MIRLVLALLFLSLTAEARIDNPRMFIGEKIFNATVGAPLSADANGQLVSGTSNTEVSATANTTTTSTTDVLLNAMTITPVAGTYMVLFSTSMSASTGNQTTQFSIYVGGVQKADSVRLSNPGNATGLLGLTFTPGEEVAGTQGVVTVNGSQAIAIEYHTSAGTATVHQRTLNIIRLL